MIPIRVARGRRRADEWALVLAAEGLAPEVDRVPDGYAICVPEHEAERAQAALVFYERENAREFAPAESEAEPVADAPSTALALFWAAGLLLFFRITGPRSRGVAWFDRGSADAEAILSGEVWRCVTALTLHADLAHAVGNALVGGFFVAAACRPLGAGVGSAAIVLSAAVANAANAWMHGVRHSSVGASTAVFAAVGVLAAGAAVRRQRLGLRGRRAWAPLAAGVGLLAMLGTGGIRVDLGGHVLGLLVGAVIGVPLSFATPRLPRAWVQWMSGAITAFVIAGAWWWGLHETR